MEGPATSAPWESLLERVGTEIGVSAWRDVPQPLIDTFGTATGDRYFLHVDPQRAAASPFGGTIAHGMLTLSLLSAMSYEVCPFVEGARNPLNYGFDRIRFVAPVRVGSRVRARFSSITMDVTARGRGQYARRVPARPDRRARIA
jgi:acyl dehydratase